MRPSEISLFSPSEQTLLVETEPKRLDKLNEDELVKLLGRVRRVRNKYSDLHRRQGASTVRSSGKRYAATTSNTRTLRKAEIMEDAVSRVARYVSRAARANANAVKEQRLEDARTRPGSKKTKSKPKPRADSPKTGSSRAKKSEDIVTGKRVGATSASTKRSQSKKDSRG